MPACDRVCPDVCVYHIIRQSERGSIHPSSRTSIAHISHFWKEWVGGTRRGHRMYHRTPIYLSRVRGFLPAREGREG